MGEQVAGIPHTIEKALPHLATGGHEEKPFLCPSVTRRKFLAYQGLRTNVDVAASARNVAVHQQRLGSAFQQRTRGETLMSHEMTPSIAQTSSVGAVGSKASGVGEPKHLLPEVEELPATAIQAAILFVAHQAQHSVALLVAGLHQMEKPLALARMAVGRGEDDPFVGGSSHSQRKRQALQADVASRFGTMSVVEVRIAVLETLQYILRVVCAEHIDHDDFIFRGIFLLQQDGQALPQLLCMVVASDDHRTCGHIATKRLHGLPLAEPSQLAKVNGLQDNYYPQEQETQI